MSKSSFIYTYNICIKIKYLSNEINYCMALSIFEQHTIIREYYIDFSSADSLFMLPQAFIDKVLFYYIQFF